MTNNSHHDLMLFNIFFLSFFEDWGEKTVPFTFPLVCMHTPQLLLSPYYHVDITYTPFLPIFFFLSFPYKGRVNGGNKTRNM